MQVFLQVLRAVGEHVLNAPIEQVFLFDALLVRVLKLVPGNLLDDLPLIVGHRFEDESKTKLLIIIFGGEETWLPAKFIFDRLERVGLDAHEVEEIELVVSEEHATLAVVNGDDQFDSGDRGELGKHLLPFGALELAHIH